MNRSKFAQKIILGVIAFGVSFTLSAKNVGTTKTGSFPEFNSASIGTQFDAEKIAALESRMKKFVSDGDTMGVATLLVHEGKVVSHTQAGVRDLVEGSPIADNTIYRIYSMTKPIRVKIHPRVQRS